MRHLLGLLQRSVLARDAACAARHGAWPAVPWLVVLAEQLDKVGGEQADHAPVALQPSHPPGTVARVEHFDQVAFYEPEIALGLRAAPSDYMQMQKQTRRCSRVDSPRRPTSTRPCTSTETAWEAPALRP